MPRAALGYSDRLRRELPGAWWSFRVLASSGGEVRRRWMVDKAEAALRGERLRGLENPWDSAGGRPASGGAIVLVLNAVTVDVLEGGAVALDDLVQGPGEDDNRGRHGLTGGWRLGRASTRILLEHRMLCPATGVQLVRVSESFFSSHHWRAWRLRSSQSSKVRPRMKFFWIQLKGFSTRANRLASSTSCATN